jgi:23S rRNA (guanine745-N1)-methyltransferase
MTLRELSQWLRCPKCFADLSPVDGLAIGCVNGHRFDTNKRGYVSLLDPKDRVTGDDRGMLERREQLLASGAYSPIADAVAELASSASRVIDVGCGTGYYLAKALAARADARGLGTDVSPEALRFTVRRDDRIDGLVANTWQPLPIRDDVADAVLDVFAPRNLPEFRRVLSPHGRLIIVVPSEDHLRELQDASRVLEVPSGKSDAVVADAAACGLVAASRREVRFELPATEDSVAMIVGMGPSAFHASLSGHEHAPLPEHVTVAVDVLELRKD